MPEKSKNKLIEGEDAATGAVSFGVYIRYFKSIGLALGIGAVLCNAATQGASVYANSNYFKHLMMA